MLKIISRKALVFFLCLFSLMTIYSQTSEFSSLESIVEKEVLNELIENKQVTKFSMTETSDYCKIKINTKSYEDYLKSCNEDLSYKPNYSLENLYIFEIDNIKTLEEEISYLLKLVHKFSSLEGIQYYSHSRKKMDTLYHSCYTLDNNESRKKVSDNLSESLKTEYVLFDDNSFGKYVLEANYGKNEKDLYVKMVNKDPLGFSGIKAIKSGNMKSFIDIIPCENNILVYINLSTKASVPGFLKGKILDSLMARSDALFNWLKNSYIEGDE